MKGKRILCSLACAMCFTILMLTIITPVFAAGAYYETEPKEAGSDESVGFDTEVVAHAAYMSGYPDKTFRPDKSITRAEAAQILYNLLPGKYAVLYTPSFKDVNDNSQWYYNAVGYLESLKIISGYPDGTFRPDAEITRAELVTMLSKYYGEVIGLKDTFTDVGEDHWAVSYIESAAYHGWIFGYSGGNFRPDKGCTRGETAAILNRILVRIEMELPSGDNPFADVDTSHWAYGSIMEACIAHEAEESKYHKIITKYKQAFESNYVNYDRTVVCLELQITETSEKWNVYCAFKDIDGNDIPELFIGAGTNPAKAIFDIYTLHDGEPVQLFKNMYVFGTRVNCVICSNGVFATHWSNSAFESGTSYYKISDNGYTPKLIETIIIVTPSDDDGTNKYYYTTKYFYTTEDTVEITEEQYDAIAKEYPESYKHYRGVENLDWITILDY